MFHEFVIISLIVAATADPFHKYPYIFLLDVGNEEIQNTVSEQIRISIPGGSLALKYPAIPGEDAISHVRVSGIDFGTDLKANIVEGGPGYNYVVLAFMGNQGITYDAVITIEFLENAKDVDNTDNDENNSAEDMNDESDRGFSKKFTKEAMVASSNVYKYVNRGSIDTKYNDNEPNKDSVEDGSDDDSSDDDSSDSDSVEDVSDESDSDENLDDDKQYDEKSLENDSSGVSLDEINLKNRAKSKYVSYEFFRPRLYGGVRIYPQAGLYIDDFNSRPAYDPENHENGNEEPYDDNSDKLRDPNNNIKLDYSLALE